jgi:hypothetical protein
MSATKIIKGLSNFLKLSGGTMTGGITIPTGEDITLTDVPGSGTDAANKTYVDAHISFGGIAYSGTLIKVMPTAFRVNDDYTRQPNLIEDDTADTLGFRVAHTDSEAYAFVPIPSGYKATYVTVHASDSTVDGAQCLDFNCTTGATTDLETFTLNAVENITDVTSSITKDLVIKYMGLSTATIVYGASVTIAEV